MKANCEICEAEFEKNTNKKTCSKECSATLKRNRDTERLRTPFYSSPESRARRRERARAHQSTPEARERKNRRASERRKERLQDPAYRERERERERRRMDDPVFRERYRERMRQLHLNRRAGLAALAVMKIMGLSLSLEDSGAQKDDAKG